MSAAVLMFPALVGAPVAQVRRRGRLPASVRSLPAHRAERLRKAAEVADDRLRQMKALCIASIGRVYSGEVTGIAIIEACGEEPDQISFSGHFADDYDYLLRCINASRDVVEDSRVEADES